jgi:chorismate mutase / prephenate dehydrogenase
MTHADLDALREQIRKLDEEIVARAAERVELARRVGEIKRAQSLPTVDFGQERLVLERARAAAVERGLAPGVAEDMLAHLIRASVIAQDMDRLRHAAVGAGRKAVIVGGAGRMGRWLTKFLAAQGFDVGILDPAASEGENSWSVEALRSADYVICATPPAATAALYREWVARPPAGLIVDIASIKTPLLEPIRALRAAGARVASIHPMFGPSIVLLREADVVICETGDLAAAEGAERLFGSTTARIVRMPLEEHDRVMADVLSLAHATAIAFACALPEAEHPVRSTTFQALEALAAAVVRESPDVYYEVQAENPHSAAALERMRAALDRIATAVRGRDAGAFGGILGEGRDRTSRN